jgi:hypothetical protein
MQRTIKPERTQVGALMNKRLWQRLKAQALLENRLASQLLDDAVQLYLEERGRSTADKAEAVAGILGVRR